jgi:O-antigen/teichoic acid export membrane protein
LSYPGQALAIWVLMRTGHVSLNAAFAAMAATSLLAAVLQGRQTRLRLASREECFAIGLDFWRIARWLLLSSIASFASAPLLPWLLNLARGRSEVGAFQAVYSVMSLCNPLVMSIPAIIIPAVAARRRQGGRAVWQYTLLFETLLAPLLAAMLIWPRAVLAAMYGSGSPYCAQTFALRIGVAACALAVPLSAMQSVFTGQGKTRNNAVVQTAGSLLSLLFAPLLIFRLGVTGTLLVETASRAMKTAWGAALFDWRHDRAGDDGPGWAGLQPKPGFRGVVQP